MKRFYAYHVNIQTLQLAAVLFAKLKTTYLLADDQEDDQVSQEEETPESDDLAGFSEGDDESSQGLVDPARTRVVDPART